MIWKIVVKFYVPQIKIEKNSQNNQLSETDLYLLTPKSKFQFLSEGNDMLCFKIRKYSQKQSFLLK